MADVADFLDRADEDSDSDDEQEAAVFMTKVQVVSNKSVKTPRVRNVRIDLEKTRILSRAMKLGAKESIELLTIDGAADTCATGDGWEIIAVDPLRKANIVGFDSRSAFKRGLSIVSAITATDVANKTHLMRMHEAINNPGVPCTLLSDFQVKEKTHKIDATFKRHGGTQSWHLTENDCIPTSMKECLAVVPHRLPTKTELKDITPVDITCDAPWDPSVFNDDGPIT